MICLNDLIFYNTYYNKNNLFVCLFKCDHEHDSVDNY